MSNNKENKRIDIEEALLKQELNKYNELKKAEKAEFKKNNPGKLKRTLNFTVNVFSKKDKENKKVEERNAPKGILADHADELAKAMLSAKSKNELFLLARLMKKQSQEIQRLARRI